MRMETRVSGGTGCGYSVVFLGRVSNK